MIGMIDIEGKHNSARCFAQTLDPLAEKQIRKVCDMLAFAGCKIRVMPDVHAGAGCTIGTTMTLKDKVTPNMVGVDIGCGMEAVKLAQQELDFESLDQLIRRAIPSGRDIRQTAHPLNAEINLEELRCIRHVNLIRAGRSLGTLGGGNHFIEVDRGQDGALWLVIHSGSRHIGVEVAEYYQEQGQLALQGRARYQVDALIASLKAQGRQTEIEKAVKELREGRPSTDVPDAMAWVEGQLFDDYIHDMRIIQRFAVLNRRAMAQIILEGAGLTEVDSFTTIHVTGHPDLKKKKKKPQSS